MAPRKIDAINEGAEAEAFWYMSRRAEEALVMMERGVVPTPPHITARHDARYRLAYICENCESEHRVEGTLPQVFMGAQALILANGARQVRIETIDFALNSDADHAESIPATTPDYLNDLLSRKPHA